MNMSRKLGLSLIAAALLTLYGCGKEEPKKAAEAPKAPAAPVEEVVVVKIGHAGPLTGGIAHLGKDNENGVRLALDEANARNLKIGGKKVKFELMAEDDQADPKLGPTIAQKFADAKVAGVVGHLNSGVTIPASAVYNQAGIPMISGSATNPKLTEQGFKNVFRTVGRDDQQGPAVAQYLNGMKFKKVAIVDDATAYGEGLANEVEKTLKAAGVQIVAREKTNDKATDFKAILTKMKGKAPDAVFYGGMDATGGPMLKQARELGIKSVFAFGDGACTDEMAQARRRAPPKGSSARRPACRSKRPARTSSTSFNGKYGEIKQYAPFTYDAAPADHRDAEGRLDRPGQVPAGAAEDQHERRHGQDRVRRQGRPQERRDHDLHAEGRQGRAGRRRASRQELSSFAEFMKDMVRGARRSRTRRGRRRRRLRPRRRPRPKRRRSKQTGSSTQNGVPRGAVFFGTDRVRERSDLRHPAACDTIPSSSNARSRGPAWTFSCSR